MKSAPFLINEAEVVLNLESEAAPENRERLLAFCRRAFPIYESLGGEAAIKDDPIQSALIAEWRALLKTPPRVSVYTKLSR